GGAPGHPPGHGPQVAGAPLRDGLPPRGHRPACHGAAQPADRIPAGRLRHVPGDARRHQGGVDPLPVQRRGPGEPAAGVPDHCGFRGGHGLRDSPGGAWAEKTEDKAEDAQEAEESAASAEAAESAKDTAQDKDAESVAKKAQAVVPALGKEEKQPEKLQYSGPSEGGGVEKRTEDTGPDYANTPRNA